MLHLTIPGYNILQLEYLVLDYNGTLALDGKPIAGVKQSLQNLSQRLDIHVLTADTFGSIEHEFADVPCCRVSILDSAGQDVGKLNYVKQLGAAHSVCLGNGRNDRLMLQEAALGIAVIQEEGAAAKTIMAADIVCTSIITALNLLAHPLRLTATLRR